MANFLGLIDNLLIINIIIRIEQFLNVGRRREEMVAVFGIAGPLMSFIESRVRRTPTAAELLHLLTYFT